MARPTIFRKVVFAAICIASLVGVWAARSFGKSHLGPVGGILVALLAALMLGAMVYILGVLFFKEVPHSPSQRRSDSVC